MWDTVFVDYEILTASQNGQPYGWIRDQALALQDGRIAWIGPKADSRVARFSGRVNRGEGRFLSPGLIDCHTHLVYGGCRAAEWEQRLAGASYEQISRGGGGIRSTVRATRSATEDQLYAAARDRIQRWIAEGVTTIEIKSGYGLDIDSELKLLRVATELGRSMPIDISRTLLAAHAVPEEFDGRADDYIDLICEQLIPQARGYCEAVDAFCEPIAFSWRQCERVFLAAGELNLGLKIHAEQLTHTGSALASAKLGAWSVDHLERLTDAEAAALGDLDSVAVLLPGAYYFLRDDHPPPVTALRANLVPMAVATDCNPGSSPIGSLLLAMNMACTLFGLLPEEAFVGATRHAARALRLDDRMGTIEVGKQADLAVWNIGSPAELACAIGQNPCYQIYKQGQCVLTHD